MKFLLLLLFISCTTTEQIAFEPPIGASDPVVDEAPTQCTPTSLEHFHKRCKAIYNRSDYCVKYYREKQNKDGSKHIDILCGVQ